MSQLRRGLAALLFLVSAVTLTSAFSLPNRSPDSSSPLGSLRTLTKPTQHHTALTFADRVAYQRAIEKVYWRHRIWPKERPDPKPSLDEVMPPAQLEQKVEDYLRNSQALEDYWKEPLTAEQLQAEMERMAKHTKQAEVLRELFKALGNDPFVIAECLARPSLSERLLTNFYAHDERFHGELKERADADLRAHHTVQRMKQISGQYSEIELVKSDNAQDEENRGTEGGLKLNSSEWDENLQKLAAMFATANPSGGGFGDAKDGRARPQPARRGGDAPITQIKTGILSSLQEDAERYYATAVLDKSKDRLKLATVEWRKEPLESWKARAENQVPKVMLATSAHYTLPRVLDATATTGCTNDTWKGTAGPPDGRQGHTAVWTGSEMIIWGGNSGGSDLNTGGRYNPSTDTWTATTTSNEPSARSGHTAVWTGTEMIVWGGSFYDTSDHDLNTGGKYNPATDSWTVTSTIGAPTARSAHTAVWTGSQMIVWGGYAHVGYGYFPFHTGGRYNPSTNSWTATSVTSAPSARDGHTAVWTGSEMIVWGGYDESGYGGELNTGGRYNPDTDSWLATSTTNAPTGRVFHTAVWTGSEMIVWGGGYNTGGRYNPSADTWTATSTINAPSARNDNTAVWSGSEMIVWGSGDYLNTGGRYKPSTDSWTATSTANAPSGRSGHTAIWTGSEMIVWGGTNTPYVLPETGGRYDPRTDGWMSTGTADAPTPRRSHTAVWTGSEMIVWGGRFFNGTGHDLDLNTGGKYNPAVDTWTATSTANAPTGRYRHTAVWTGSEMIIWGGDFSNTGLHYLNTGGRYNPSTNSWAATSTTNAPTGREAPTAVWTGSEMIVWGGYFYDTSDHFLNTGGRYNPRTNSWTVTSTTNAPTGREGPTAVWTGSEMIVWGGDFYDTSDHSLNTGGRYNPRTNSWTATSTTNAPTGRSGHTAVWTGNEMIIWGGFDQVVGYVSSGGRYDPSIDSWTATNAANAPGARSGQRAVWTGSEMIVWGGFYYDYFTSYLYFNTGGRYNPRTDNWTATSTANAPTGRASHTAVWTGSEMIVWGGDFSQAPESITNTGGRYCAPPSLLGNISTRAFVQTGDNVTIGGFIITGTAQKTVIVRAIGPSLAQHGIANPLQNPTLELHDHTGAVIASNDNWMNAPNRQEIINSGLAPTNNLESAILTSLDPGNSTAVVSGVNNGTGVALVEVYDLDQTAGSKLSNVSTRAFVQTGDNVMIGGVIITGPEEKEVIVRAIGPSLAQQGIMNPLLDPTLELHNGNGAVIAFNDNWRDTQQPEIEATGLSPTDDRESALVGSLTPGNYTAIVRGKNNTMGVALAEVYDLQ